MGVKIDFLTKEIFIKIFSKSLGVLRTIYLLYLFGAGNNLDDFYLSKSIIGLVILINILFETNYSNQLKKNVSDNNFVKKFLILINKFGFFLCLIVLGSVFFYFGVASKIFIHVALLCIWALLNINSNYLLLVYRYKLKNYEVLIYYFLIALFDILLLMIIFNGLLNNSDYNYISISLSMLVSELLVFFLVFYRFVKVVFFFKADDTFKLNLDLETFYKVLGILIFVALIDITDKIFLSFLGEGKITYYTYGLYAPLVIRQSLDIRSNFFVQINMIHDMNDVNKVFFKTIKKLAPFFITGSICLVIVTETFENQIVNWFKLDNFSLLKSIIYIGIIITPFYMIWDLFYRLYYRQRMVKKLLTITLFGFLLNIIFDYVLSIVFNWGVLGVLISTLFIFAFYNFISYKTFFFNKNIHKSKFYE